MADHLRVASPWSQLGIFLGLLGGAFILSSVLSFFVLLSSGIQLRDMENLDWNNPKLIATLKWIQGLSSILLFLLPAVIYARISFSGNPFHFLGFRKAERQAMYGLAIVVILLAFPFVIWIGELNQKIPLPEWMTRLEKDATQQMEALLKVNKPMDLFVNILIIAILPAICEEICFRGAMQRIFIQCTRSPWAGIIITSILFSALHFQFQGFLPRMFLGILLGALYWYSGSLWTCILAHFVNNGVQVVAVSFAPQYVTENPSIPVFAGLISALCITALMWVYLRLSTASYARVYDANRLSGHDQFLA